MEKNCKEPRFYYQKSEKEGNKGRIIDYDVHSEYKANFELPSANGFDICVALVLFEKKMQIKDFPQWSIDHAGYYSKNWDTALIKEEMLCDWIYPYYLSQRAKFLSTLPIEINFKPLKVRGNKSLKLFDSQLFDKLVEDKMSAELQVEFKQSTKFRWGEQKVDDDSEKTIKIKKFGGTFDDAKIIYIGEFDNKNQLNGRGIFISRSFRYDGFWQDTERCGYGRSILPYKHE